MARLSPQQSRHDTLLAAGRDALLAGDKAEAQAQLNAALQLNPDSEEAWVWLSGTHSDPAAMAMCLERVLAINPHNEQAQEGLRWIEEQYGEIRAAESSAEIRAAEQLDPPVSAPITLHPRRELERSAAVLLEAALHPFAVGVLLGLLRLVGWLRPQTLLLMRDGGPLSLGSAGSVALAAALLHGCALLVVWLLLSWQFSRVRSDGRGDHFDSLRRAGRLWLPGYVALMALPLAASGLLTGPALWRIIAVVCWALLLGGAAAIVARLWHTLEAVAVPYHKRPLVAARLLAITVLGSVLGLGSAGIVTAALLR